MKIGTITFIKPETNEFVALGHSTLKEKNKKSMVVGSCYEAILTGIEKGSAGETGSIVAMSDKSNQIGYIYYDSNYGIFGKVNGIEEEFEEVDTACWYNVRKGKANILIALNSNTLKSYEVEIIGLNYINKNRNIKIKVTDKELIEQTGGIVQGMSGAPIVQNGKLIGCITHVLLDDPLRGYGAFIENMIKDMENI